MICYTEEEEEGGKYLVEMNVTTAVSLLNDVLWIVLEVKGVE